MSSSSKDLYENWFLKLETNIKYRLIEFIHGILKEKNSIDNNQQILYLENKIEELKLNHENVLAKKIKDKTLLLEDEITDLKDRLQSKNKFHEETINSIKKMYEEEIDHIKNSKTKEMENFEKVKKQEMENLENLKNKEIRHLEQQIKHSSDVASIYRALSNKDKGNIHELLEIDNLRNYFPNEDIYDVSEMRGNGDINCVINNTNVMIECKNYSQNTIKKSFSSVYEKFVNTFEESDGKFHFGVLAFSYAEGIPVKLPNGKYTHSKNNNIELEFIGNRFVLIVPNSLENKSHNLLWAILIGIKMHKQNLTNKDPSDIKFKFKKAQEFLESFKKKIADNTKILKSIYESLYSCMDEIDNLLEILFYEDEIAKEQLKDHEEDILKVISYLQKNKLSITQQNIIQNKGQCQIKLSNAKLRKILKDNWKNKLMT